MKVTGRVVGAPADVGTWCLFSISKKRIFFFTLDLGESASALLSSSLFRLLRLLPLPLSTNDDKHKRHKQQITTE